MIILNINNITTSGHWPGAVRPGVPNHGTEGDLVLRPPVPGQQGLPSLAQTGEESPGPAGPSQDLPPPPGLPGEVLRRGRVGGAGAGGDPAPVLPADQGPDPQHEDLLPARGQRSPGQLCRAGQVRRLRGEYLPARDSGQRGPPASEGDRPVPDDQGDVGGEDQGLVRGPQGDVQGRGGDGVPQDRPGPRHVRGQLLPDIQQERVRPLARSDEPWYV